MTAIRLDTSWRTTVATCTSCPSWRVLRTSRSAAQLEAAAHLVAVHELKGAAKDLRELARRADKPQTG